MFSRILVPLDGSPLAEGAIPHAELFARIFGSSIILLQVLDPTSYQEVPNAVDPLRWQLRKAEADAYMQGIAHRIRKNLGEKSLMGEDEKKSRVDYFVREGKTAENIVDFAHTENIDLMVISTHGSSGLSRWNISSVTQKVINLIYLPVLIVRAFTQPISDESIVRYRRILIPIDCSRRAECSLTAGIELARGEASTDRTTEATGEKSTLFLAAVIRPPELPIPEPFPIEISQLSGKLLQLSHQAVDRYLYEMKERLPVNCDTCVVESTSVPSFNTGTSRAGRCRHCSSLRPRLFWECYLALRDCNAQLHRAWHQTCSGYSRCATFSSETNRGGGCRRKIRETLSISDDQGNNIREPDFPGSGNSFSSKSEQMQDLVNFLVSNYQEISRVPMELDKKIVIGGHDLKVYKDWLEKVHTYFREALNRDLTLTLAAEWVLDNYYIIRQALLQIEEDLSPGYYQQLPKLAGGPLKGLPRIYAIGWAVLSFQNYLLNTIDLEAVLIQIQEHVPLTMGELWALPIFLRYSLIETLTHALEWIIRPQPFPDLPVFPQQLVGTGDPFTANQTSTNDTLTGGVVANIILSLRTISEQNWSDFFEAASSLERTLRKDPARIYPLIDFENP